ETVVNPSRIKRLTLIGRFLFHNRHFKSRRPHVAFLPGRKGHGDLHFASLRGFLGCPNRTPKTAPSLSPIDKWHPQLDGCLFRILMRKLHFRDRAKLLGNMVPPGPYERGAFFLEDMGADKDMKDGFHFAQVADPLAILDDASFAQSAGVRAVEMNHGSRLGIVSQAHGSFDGLPSGGTGFKLVLEPQLGYPLAGVGSLNDKVLRRSRDGEVIATLRSLREFCDLTTLAAGINGAAVENQPDAGFGLWSEDEQAIVGLGLVHWFLADGAIDLTQVGRVAVNMKR